MKKAMKRQILPLEALGEKTGKQRERDERRKKTKKSFKSQIFRPSAFL